jgi:hypothetical protein
MIDPTRRQLITALPTAAALPIAAEAQSRTSGQAYPDLKVALSSTAIGQLFAVDNHDGTVTIYVNRGRDALAQFTFATSTSLASHEGATKIGYTPEGEAATTRAISSVVGDLGLNLKSFGKNVGTGTSSVDTAAWRAALMALATTGMRKLIIPAGEYLIEDAILSPKALNCIEIVGQGGYDGIGGPINKSLHTSLKWVGPADPNKAVITFDQASGVIWRGISVNCNYRAGYGLQLMSSSKTTGSTKNIVEHCTFAYALRDGIIVGDWGNPTANPADRQFFGNRFVDLTFYGCGYAGIHINEWNADQQFFDTVMVYHDDGYVQNARYGIWFDSGGQASVLDNCCTSGLDVVSGEPGTGYSIFNKKADSTIGGAFGLDVRNFWQEGSGGLYYGITSTNDQKSFKFSRCAAFSETELPSIYINKGTPSKIPYTFSTCTFKSNIQIASDSFDRESLKLLNCIFFDDKGVVDSRGTHVKDGMLTQVGTDGDGFSVPRFAELVHLTLDRNLNSLTTEHVTGAGSRLVLMIFQDAAGGHEINWAKSRNFSRSPPIPQPASAPSSGTVYSFISDGERYYLASVARA